MTIWPLTLALIHEQRGQGSALYNLALFMIGSNSTEGKTAIDSDSPFR